MTMNDIFSICIIIMGDRSCRIWMVFMTVSTDRVGTVIKIQMRGRNIVYTEDGLSIKKMVFLFISIIVGGNFSSW